MSIRTWDMESLIVHMSKAKRAILIAGPTASGKSALALRLAGQHGGLIINADSMQVYRELRILTARPDDGDEARAPHRLFGHVSAATTYSVGRWLADVADALAEAQAARLMPILVGGTGLYFMALTQGLSDIPDIQPEIKARWRRRARLVPAAALHRALARRDPLMAARLRASDPQRIVRALEVIEATGRSLADWQQDAGRPLIHEDQAHCILMAPERDALYRRCDQRIEQMMLRGAVEEVEALLAVGLPPDVPAMRAIGVREIGAFLRGQIGLAEAKDRMKTQTRRYAKRQMTWARRNMISWNVASAQ
jgi:tRNA dimethylallyltransferase